MSLTSVILPTYNEAENIVPLLESLQSALKKDYELIVVDDDSPDGTSQTVKKYIKEHKKSFVRLETRLSDHGLTKSIQHGINTARGDIIVWMDCDFSMPPEFVPTLIDHIHKGYDIAFGSRFIPGGKQKKINNNESQAAVFFSTVLNKTMRIVFRVNVYDFTSGFIAIRKDIVRHIPLQGDYGEYFIDLIVRAHRKKYTIIELPFTSAPRQAGESKSAPNLAILLKRGVQYGGTVIRLLLKHTTYDSPSRNR